MNSCILMAQVASAPELRYTQDNQTPVAEMLVEFPGLRQDDPPATVKVVGWGNLATRIQQERAVGDRLIIEGRLQMNAIDRPEGFKEKRTELIAYRIHPLAALASASAGEAETGATGSSEAGTAARVPETSAAAESEANLDDIPF
ncbi:MAG: single-stranded DNA-binding protein [Cyanobacteria bacterium QS_8_64_29]|nr:MAG: single-stranded DNA-binding protein [Cyanobacteria bacterium QS_8_64_29]